MARLVRGDQTDTEDALDLKATSKRIDALMAQLEESELSANDALWTAALFYLKVYDATDQFANLEVFSAAARALIKDAIEVFESLPEPDDEDEEPEESEDDDDDEAEPTSAAG